MVTLAEIVERNTPSELMNYLTQDSKVNGEFAYQLLKKIVLPTAVVNGKKTVTTAGTAVELGSTSELVNGVNVKALLANTDKIYVGDSEVSSSNGFELSAGDQVFVACTDLASIHIDAAVNGEGVSFLGG